MKILIVSATLFEIEPSLMLEESIKSYDGFIEERKLNDHLLYYLCTGVGMVNTTYFLTKEITRLQPDLCINVGVAGSFKKDFPIGEVVNVSEDRFADLGAEDGNNFLTLDELNLGEQKVPASEFGKISNGVLNNLKKVKAITVNKVHGDEMSIDKVIKKFDPDTESMEGAAFMIVCQREKIKHVQLRAISNFVERRNKANWNIPLAIKNLNDILQQFIKSL